MANPLMIPRSDFSNEVRKLRNTRGILPHKILNFGNYVQERDSYNGIIDRQNSNSLSIIHGNEIFLKNLPKESKNQSFNESIRVSSVEDENKVILNDQIITEVKLCEYISFNKNNKIKIENSHNFNDNFSNVLEMKEQKNPIIKSLEINKKSNPYFY